MNEYLKIANNIILSSNISLDDFDTDKLVDALKFMRTDEHVKSSTNSSLIWCSYTRDNKEENNDSFADGFSIDEYATIYSRSLWKYKNMYLICESKKDYKYCCHGNSGGVEFCNLDSNNVNVYNWETKENIKCNDLDNTVYNTIITVTSILANSQYDETDLLVYKDDINDNLFYNKLINITIV